MEGRKQCLENQCKDQVLPKEIVPGTGAKGRIHVIHNPAEELLICRHFLE